MKPHQIERFGFLIVGFTLASSSLQAYTAIYPGPASSAAINPYLLDGPGATPVANDSGYAAGNLKDQVGPGSPGVLWSQASTVTLGGSGSHVEAINSAGETAGYSYTASQSAVTGFRAIRWDPNGNPTQLTDLPSSTGSYHSQAYAINNINQVAGLGYKYVSGILKGTVAVRWDSSGLPLELGNLGSKSDGSIHASAVAINNAGETAGSASKYVSDVLYGDHPVRWSTNGTATELGMLGANSAGFAGGWAFDINESGLTTGVVEKFTSGGAYRGRRAVRWDATGMATELPGLGGNGTYDMAVFRINNSGQVVGWSSKLLVGVPDTIRAVRWESNGAAVELSPLDPRSDGFTGDSAYDINNQGIAVGAASTFDDGDNPTGTRAVLWHLDGTVLDLNSLIDPSSGWVLNFAYSISDAGWITGIGKFDPDAAGSLPAYDRLFLLQVPEPGTLLLLLPALAVKRRRQV